MNPSVTVCGLLQPVPAMVESVTELERAGRHSPGIRGILDL